MSKALKSLKIACTTDWSREKSEDMKRWIEYNGGTYCKEITDDVTHLVSTKKAWKRYFPMVRDARRKGIRIVKYDWLVDSLERHKRQNETEYYHEAKCKLPPFKPTKRKAQVDDQIHERSAKQRKSHQKKDCDMQRVWFKFNAECKQLQQKMAGAGFHIYSNSSTFEYCITLLRQDILKNQLEKHRLQVGVPLPYKELQIVSALASTVYALYTFPSSYLHEENQRKSLVPFSGSLVTAANLSRKIAQKSAIRITNPWAQCLQVYESDALPHTFAVYTQYTQSKAGANIVTEELVGPGATQELALAMFHKFFRIKTGRRWNGGQPREVAQQNFVDISLDRNNDKDQINRYEPLEDNRYFNWIREANYDHSMAPTVTNTSTPTNEFTKDDSRSDTTELVMSATPCIEEASNKAIPGYSASCSPSSDTASSVLENRDD